MSMPVVRVELDSNSADSACSIEVVSAVPPRAILVELPPRVIRVELPRVIRVESLLRVIRVDQVPVVVVVGMIVTAPDQLPRF